MQRDEIIAEIRQAADQDNGRAPGRERFRRLTGISEYDINRFWRNWGDALEEAGFDRNRLNAAKLSDDELVVALAGLALELGRYPTVQDRRMRHREDPAFPSPNVFSRLGDRQSTLQRLVGLGGSDPEYREVEELCRPLLANEVGPDATEPASGSTGYVYLIRMDKWHKIGFSVDPLRRGAEIRLSLPEVGTEVHRIETDDPYGVEQYWHRRFADRRRNGEWFLLNAADVKAFKKWRRIA